jgi:hypothetical protein
MEKEAFSWSNLVTMTIPRSVQQIGESCFASCSRLDDLAFEKESKLQRTEESAFARSGLIRIVLPNLFAFVAGSGFVEAHVYCVAIEGGEAVHAVSGSFLHHTHDKLSLTTPWFVSSCRKKRWSFRILSKLSTYFRLESMGRILFRND